MASDYDHTAEVEVRVPSTGVHLFAHGVLRRARSERGLTIRDLSLLLDVSPQAATAWEQGKSAPSPRHLRELAAVLRITADDLLRTPLNEADSREPARASRPERHRGRQGRRYPPKCAFGDRTRLPETPGSARRRTGLDVRPRQGGHRAGVATGPGRRDTPRRKVKFSSSSHKYRSHKSTCDRIRCRTVNTRISVALARVNAARTSIPNR